MRASNSVKTYATRRGAEGFMRKLQARWPERKFRVATWDSPFDTRFSATYCVETLWIDDRNPNGRWVVCSDF